MIKKATIESIKIRCPKTDKLVTVKMEHCYFSGYDSECGLCGSHGEATVEVTCTCGKSHKIEIKSW